MMLERSSLVRADFDPHMLVGVLTLAEMTGCTLESPFTQEQLDSLFGVWGKKPEYFLNTPEVAQALGLGDEPLPNETVLELLEATGVMGAIRVRSLVDARAPLGKVVPIFFGGTALWMELRIEELLRQIEQGLDVGKHIIALASDERKCGVAEDSPERHHPVVQDLYAELGSWPTEAEVMIRLMKRYHLHHMVVPGNGSMTQQLISFMDNNLGTNVPADSTFYVPTNAPATYVPLLAAATMAERFPEAFSLQRFYFSQNERRLARTPAQLANSLAYQNPLSVFSALVRLLDALLKLSQLANK